MSKGHGSKEKKARRKTGQGHWKKKRACEGEKKRQAPGLVSSLRARRRQRSRPATGSAGRQTDPAERRSRPACEIGRYWRPSRRGSAGRAFSRRPTPTCGVQDQIRYIRIEATGRRPAAALCGRTGSIPAAAEAGPLGARRGPARGHPPIAPRGRVDQQGVGLHEREARGAAPDQGRASNHFSGAVAGKRCPRWPAQAARVPPGQALDSPPRAGWRRRPRIAEKLPAYPARRAAAQFAPARPHRRGRPVELAGSGGRISMSGACLALQEPSVASRA